MSNATERVRSYLDELSTRNTLDPEVIQNLRPEVLGEISLRVSDLRAILAALEAVQQLVDETPRLVCFGGDTVCGSIMTDSITKAITEALQ